MYIYIYIYIYGAQNLSAGGRDAFTRHQRSGRKSDPLQERHPPATHELSYRATTLIRNRPLSGLSEDPRPRPT